jgi:hypothetical protein
MNDPILLMKLQEVAKLLISYGIHTNSLVNIDKGREHIDNILFFELSCNNEVASQKFY